MARTGAKRRACRSMDTTPTRPVGTLCRLGRSTKSPYPDFWKARDTSNFCLYTKAGIAILAAFRGCSCPSSEATSFAGLIHYAGFQS